MNQPAFTRMYYWLSPKLSPTVSKNPVLSLRRIVITTDHRDNVISVQGTPRRDVRRVVDNFGSVNTAINEAAVEDLRGQSIHSPPSKQQGSQPVIWSSAWSAGIDCEWMAGATCDEDK